MNMTDTNPESLGSDQWLQFLCEAPHDEVDAAIEQAEALVRSMRRHKSQATRLKKILSDAHSIYTRRFGSEWLPF